MQCPQLTISEEDNEVIGNDNSYFDKNFARKAGVPERFLEATFENTQNCCTQRVLDFTQFSRGVLILNGSNGTGKSRTACAAINYRLANGMAPGMYISCNYQVCPLIRSSRSFRADKNEMQVLTEYYTTPFLILDEVGKGDDEIISKMFVTCVLAARYDNNLPTLITTNLSKDDLADFLGADVTSRLHETAKVAVLDGKDLRQGN